MSYFEKQIDSSDAIFATKVQRNEYKTLIVNDVDGDRVQLTFSDIQDARRLILVLDQLLVSWHNDRKEDADATLRNCDTE